MKMSEQEEIALTKYRTKHGNSRTLADVKADGGVDAWAQWSGEKKTPGQPKASTTKPSPARKNLLEELDAADSTSLPAKKMSEQEARALAQYRSKYGNSKTLEDVKAHGGVDEWAQWTGEKKTPGKPTAAPTQRVESVKVKATTAAPSPKPKQEEQPSGDSGLAIAALAVATVAFGSFMLSQWLSSDQPNRLAVTAAF